jgi:hypothetical protein
MSETNWGSDHLESPKKRKIPLWLLGCGGGCMFLIGALIVVAIIAGPRAVDWVEGLSKPEVQWPRVAEKVPFDEAPSGFSIARLPFPVVDMWILRSSEQDLTVFMLAAAQDKDGGPWGKWMSEPKSAPFFSGLEGEIEVQEGTLVVQGRELRSTRYLRSELPAHVPEHPQDPHDSHTPDGAPEPPLAVTLNNSQLRGNGICLDVTMEGSSERLLVWMFRSNEGNTVSDEEAKAFLAPFHVGPRR